MSSGSGRSSSGLKHSLIYFSTVVAGQGLAFLLLPFVTRAMTPAEYGDYSLALAVSTLVGMFTSAWLRNVSMRLYFDARDAGRTRGFYLSIATVQASAFTVVFTATTVVLSFVGASPVPTDVMISAGIATVLGDLMVFTTMLLRAEQRSTAFAASEITSGAVRFASTLAGLALGFNTANMLFYATSLGLAIALGIAITRLWQSLQGPTEFTWELALPVIRHGPAALPFSVADWAERLADRLILEHFFDSAVVGIYTVGYTIGERTVGLLERAVFMMAWPGIISAWQNDGRSGARKAIADAQWFNGWFTSGPTVLLVVYGPQLLMLFVGAEYHDAANLVPIVAVSMWLNGQSTYVNRHMELTKRFGQLSTVRSIGAVVNVVLNVVLIPRLGMQGAALATLGSRALTFLIFMVMRDRSITPLPLAPFLVTAGWAGGSLLVAQLVPGGLLIECAVVVLLYGPAALYALRRRGS